MLLVKIENIDDSYVGVFNTDDKQVAAEAALADLVKGQGFFAENRVHTEFPPAFTPDAGLYGILLMPGEGEDEEDLEYRVDRANTYRVQVIPYGPGTMIAT